MDDRSRLFGLYACLIGAAASGAWPGSAAVLTAGPAAGTDRVTVIPGSTSPEPPAIDYQRAQPLPLPSATWSGTDSRPQDEPRPPGTATSSPGSRGSGEQHMRIVPPR